MNDTKRLPGIGPRRGMPVPFRPPVLFKSPTCLNRKLVDVLPGGSWAGKPAFVIGGGPSLIGFDWRRLKGQLTIGVNRAFEQFDPTILFAMDGRFLRWLLQGAYGPEALAKFKTFPGLKVWLLTHTARLPADVLVVPVLKNYSYSLDNISWRLEDGIAHGNNSGFAAFNLALCLGANPIYLLGFDFKHRAIIGPGGERTERSHFHEGHPIKTPPDKTMSYKRPFEKHAAEIKAKGIRVVNLNRASALRAFEFGDIEAIPGQAKKTRPKPGYIIVSYFTAGTSYEKVIEDLKRSLLQHGLPNHIFSFPPTGTWRGNLNYKSECIRTAMDLYPNLDIVFVDADAIIRQYPVLFDALSKERTYDISAHFFRYRPESGDADELLSGTLWIQNGPMGRKIVEAWHKTGLAQPKVRHQMCLKLAIEELKAQGERVRVFRHPFAYTAIFDYPLARLIKPVIEHFQASRKYRREVGYGVNMITQKQSDP